MRFQAIELFCGEFSGGGPSYVEVLTARDRRIEDIRAGRALLSELARHANTLAGYLVLCGWLGVEALCAGTYTCVIR